MRMPPYLSLFKRPLFLLFIYMLFSALLMNFSDTQSLRPIRWALLKTVNFVDDVKSAFAYRRHLFEENDRLKKENFDLQISSQQLREVVMENMRLREMLSIKDTSAFDFVAAQVVAHGPEKGIRSFVLDVGEASGVSIDMAVVNADGLVGRIYSSTGAESIVQILMDHNCRVSARLQASREIGIVSWSGGKFLELEYIPENVRIEKGEWVVTSGLSKIYPAGMKIGVVAEVEENQYNLFKTVRLQPAVNFNALEEVFIVRTEMTGSDAVE